MKKLEQLTMQNYLYLKFPLANLQMFSGVFVAKILLENVFIQTFSDFSIFSDLNTAMSSSSNEANLLQASHFDVVFSARFYKRCQCVGPEHHTFVMFT